MEFVAERKRSHLRATEAKEDSPRSDWTLNALLLACVVAAAVGLYLNSTAPAPTVVNPDDEDLGPTRDNRGAAATPGSTNLALQISDERIDREVWHDDPKQLQRELGAPAIFFSPRAGASRVRLGTESYREGDSVLEGRFVVAKITPTVVFLTDREGRLHRLIDPQQWKVAADVYKWTPIDTTPPPSNEPPLDPKREH